MKIDKKFGSSLQSLTETSEPSLLTAGEVKALKSNLQANNELGKLMNSPIVNMPLVGASNNYERRESYDVTKSRLLG